MSSQNIEQKTVIDDGNEVSQKNFTTQENDFIVFHEEGNNKFQNPESFMGWEILEQFPTKGGEADIFLVQKHGEKRVWLILPIPPKM